jgi:hypothetical protein
MCMCVCMCVCFVCDENVEVSHLNGRMRGVIRLICVYGCVWCVILRVWVCLVCDFACMGVFGV